MIALSLTSSIAFSQNPVGDIKQVSYKHQAKESANSYVTVELKDVTVRVALEAIAKSASVRMQYQSQAIDSISKLVTLKATRMPLDDALKHVLSGTALRIVPISKGFISIKAEGISFKHSSEVEDKKNEKKGIIVGTVIDSITRERIPGATVSLVGRNTAVITQNDGSFSFTNLPAGSYTLSVKILGYSGRNVSVEVEDGKTKSAIFYMVQSSTSLSEVVTTALGKQRRVEVPSDVVRIDPEKIMERAPVQTLTDLIEAAHVPGVLVQRSNGEPGAPSRIRIRGIKSITQSRDPVVMVDGNFIDATVGSPSGIDDIDPATIESIEIVRGPSASTLYGQDATNGVIVITTKRGRVGPSRWNVSYDRNWGQTYGRIPVAYRGVGYSFSGFDRPCNVKDVADGVCVQDSVIIYDPNHPLLGREGTETTNRLVAGVSGGTDVTRYSVTFTSDKTIGVRRMRPINEIRYRLMGMPVESKYLIPKTEDKSTVNLGVTLLPSPNMTLGFSLIGAQTRLADNQMDIEGYESESGSHSKAIHAYSLDTITLMTSTSKVSSVEAPTERLNVNLGSTLHWSGPRDWFIQGNAGISRSTIELSNFGRNTICPALELCSDTFSVRYEARDSRMEITARGNIRKAVNLGSFSRVMDIRPSMGVDFRKSQAEGLNLSADKIPAGERSIRGTSQIGDLTSLSRASAGWYASVTVGVFQRIYFDLGLRNDLGSASVTSKLGSMKYPKLGGSWLVSDEGFWQRSRLTSIFETFRARGAIGYAGIQPEPGDIRGEYSVGTRYVNQAIVPGTRFMRAGNTRLKPERSMEVELGVDFDMLNDKITVVANYAQTVTNNAIITRALPPSAGMSVGASARNRKENIGQLRNRSLEATTQFRPVDTRQARLELSYSVTLRENLVTRLGSASVSSRNDHVREGYPVGAVWGKRLLGYRDLNEDGLISAEEVVISDDGVYLGWTQPRMEGGYGINMSLLGGLTFDTRLTTRSRYVTVYTRENRYGLEDISAPHSVQADEVGANMNRQRAVSEVRWNSAGVSYHLPQKFVRGLKMNSLRLNVRGSNLGLWSNYAGRDPSVNSEIMTSEIGIENGNEIPRSRIFNISFTLGI